MKPFDGEAFGKDMAVMVRSYVDQAIKPLMAQIAELEGALREAEKRAADCLKNVPELIGTEVAKAVSAIPPPEAGIAGKDGLGLAGAMIDRDGELVVTLSNGVLQRLGPVVGKDGAPGRDGKNGVDGKDGAPGRDGVDGKDGRDGAPGKDGEAGRNGIDGKDGAAGRDGLDGKDGAPGLNGKDGRDGFSLSDFDVDNSRLASEKIILLRFASGDTVETTELFMPYVRDCGIYSETGEYLQGDGVTFGGSFWIAQRDTSTKPGDGNADWRLAVKRGRDGKDFKGMDKRPSPEPVKI